MIICHMVLCQDAIIWIHCSSIVELPELFSLLFYELQSQIVIGAEHLSYCGSQIY